ncbi:Ankyrin-2 [Neopestalotiopsis sp. 37M]|nr:Ankyrin-2 [Neopestalotiopsis sp. 37M]
MASFSESPVEIVRIVLEFIPKINDLFNLALTSRRLHDIVISELYKRDDRNSRRGLMWGAMFGSIKVVQLFMDNGADPNWYWRTDRKGPWSGDFYISPVPGRLALGEYTTSDDCGRVSQYDRYGRHLPAHYRSRDFPYLPIDAQFPDVSRGSRYWSPLHLAVREGHLDIVRLLLRHGADANRSCRGVCACSIPRRRAARTDPSFQGSQRAIGYRQRWSALHIAICSGHDEVAFALLHAGVSICVDSEDRGITALHDACRHGRLAVAQFILENSFQADLGASDNLGKTPLDYAFMYEQWGCFEYLVNKGANLTGIYRMLTDAITHGEYATVHRVLYCIIERLASSEARLESINPVLMDNIPLAHILFNPLPIYDRCERGGSQAEMSLRLDCLRSLLEAGEDVDGRDPRHKNQTLLMAAVLEGFTEGIRLLLDSEASVDDTNDDGDTALVLACRTGQSADIVEMLLQYGADASRGNTLRRPLDEACYTYFKSPFKRLDGQLIVMLLLDYGATPTVQNFGRALRYNDISAARLLHSKLDTSSLGPEDILGLFRAVWTSDTSFLELVLDIDQEDTIIKDKLSLVRLVGYSPRCLELASILLARGALYNYWSEEQGRVLFWAISRGLFPAFVEKDSQGRPRP